MEVEQIYTEVENILKKHNVTLSNAMIIGQHIVTNAQVGLVLATIEGEKVVKDDGNP